MSDEQPRHLIAESDESTDADSAHEPDHDHVAPRHARKRRGTMFVLFVASLTAVALVLGVVVFYVVRGIVGLSNIERDQALNPIDYEGRPAPPSSAPGVERPPINIVLMGADTREGDRGRSDSLMVAHISGDRRHVYIVSFPRDMWVSIPGHGKGKINAAYAYGRAPLTVRTLEQLTGVRMDHTAVIDFEGFIKLTDALGGVTVYNPWTTEQDPGMRFEKGDITLQGERALAYVRERYQLPNGDLDRAYRQRTVVKAIIKQTFTPRTLANPSTFNSVVGLFSDCLTVDQAMTNSYIMDLGLQMRFSGSDGVRLLQAPILGFAKVGDQAVDVVDDKGVAELSTAMATDTMEDYYAAHGNDTPDSLGPVAPPR